MTGTSRFGNRGFALLLAGVMAMTSANAQSGQPAPLSVNIHEGLAIGAVVGVVALAAAVVAFLVLHNRAVAVGCIAESGGKKTFAGSDKKIYTLLDTGQPLPVGDRAKLKGHKSGPASAPSFRVDKVLKDYGRCPA